MRLQERRDQAKKSQEQLQNLREETVEQAMVECDDSRSSGVVKAEEVLALHNEELEKLNKKLKSTQGFRKYKLLLDLQQKRKNRIANLQSTAATLASRMKQLQPSGWKDFLQVSLYLHSRSVFAVC